MSIYRNGFRQFMPYQDDISVGNYKGLPYVAGILR